MVNFRLLWGELPNLGAGALYTISISVGAVCIGIVLGLVNAMLRLSSRRWLYYPATIYTEAFRNTPMLVQILLLWFGVFPMLGIEAYLTDFDTFLQARGLLGEDAFFLGNKGPILAGITALGLNSGAYLGEIFRGGIQSIDKGQREAALSLGLSEYQSMRYVVLPQALANAVPALGNEFVTLIKDSSLLSVLAVLELTHRAELVGGRRLDYFTMYIGIGFVYFLICFSLSRYMARLEKTLRVGYK